MPQNVVIGHPENALTPVTVPFAKYNCKVRYFPDNQIKIACFSRPVFNPDHWEDHKTKKQEQKANEIYHNENVYQYDAEHDEMSYKFISGKTIIDPFSGECLPLGYMKDKDRGMRTDNIKRAKDKAFEIGLSNDFKYFITLTLDRTKIDRYDKTVIYPKLRDWLSNRVRRNNMKYILFPEYHKLEEGQTDRAIHFHGLISADYLHLVDSGKRTKNDQPIYNLSDWKYGFSTVIELDGRTAIVRYVTKYITKDNEKILGKHYLSGGKDLKREVPHEFLNMDYSNFDGQEYTIPGACLSVKYKTFNLDYE